MKTATRFFWGVLALLLVAWLGASLFFTLAGGGNPPLATGPSGDGRPASENVYTHIRVLVDTLPKWDNRWNCLAIALHGKTNWSACAETAAAMLAAHSNAFACAERIVAAPDSRWLPGMAWQRFTSDVVTLQKVGLLYRVRARAEAEHGDIAAGREELLALGRLGMRVKRLGVLPYLIGSALFNVALGDAVKLPFAVDADSAWLECMQDLIRAASSDELILEAVENERDMRRVYFSAPAAELAGSSGSWLLATLLGCFPGYGNYAFQSEICIRKEMEELDRLQEKVKGKHYDRDYATETLACRRQSVFRLFRRNWLGEEKLQRDGLRDFYRFLSRGRFYEISYDVALACRCYRIRHGAWPSSLGALVPDWLAAVPSDPFDGQPLRYDTTNHYIWTKGPDGTFDGKIDFGPYGTPSWRKAKDSRWVRFLDVEGRGDASRRTNFAFYVPGWMRTRSRDDETWHSFTNVFSGARCERWSWNGDCAWKKAMRNADQAAHGLADEVARMPDGARTNMTLVGHSLGARIVVRTLAELAGKGLKVKQGILLGAAIPNADPDLERAGKASCLPVLAVCNPKDMTLKYAYGAAGGESAPAFGTDGAPRPLENMVECPVSATVTEQTEVEAAWGKSEAIKKIASHHALFYLAALRAILDGVPPENRQMLVPQGRINVEMKVLDAGIWWDVLETTNGWKLERNKLTGHCRILDPEKKRKAWGTEADMRKAFVKLCGQLQF